VREEERALYCSSLLDDEPGEEHGAAAEDAGAARPGAPGGGALPYHIACGHAALLLALAAVWLTSGGGAEAAGCLLSGPRGQEASLLAEEHRRLAAEHERLRTELATAAPRVDGRAPFLQIVGPEARKQPEMYGKVPEMTIWTYWHDKDRCPNSTSCALPHQVQLCLETVRKHRGKFQHKVVHADEVEKYLSLAELPVAWRHMEEAPQREAVVAALLARYGGVALHAATLLLVPLDDHWEEMVRLGATMRGYAFRANGAHWERPEVLATWLLMSRREGLFRTAARNLIVWMGDGDDLAPVSGGDFQLLDQTLLPVLEAFNNSLPKCTADPTVRAPVERLTTARRGPAGGRAASRCPEAARTSLPIRAARRGEPRNDMRILLRDPRDGPLLPFAAYEDMVHWDVEDARPTAPSAGGLAEGGEPAALEAAAACSTPKECWHDVFLARLRRVPRPGEASLLPCIPLVGHERAFEGMTRQDILSRNGSFFNQWLKLAGLGRLP